MAAGAQSSSSSSSSSIASVSPWEFQGLRNAGGTVRINLLSEGRMWRLPLYDVEFSRRHHPLIPVVNQSIVSEDREKQLRWDSLEASVATKAKDPTKYKVGVEGVQAILEKIDPALMRFLQVAPRAEETEILAKRFKPSSDGKLTFPENPNFSFTQEALIHAIETSIWFNQPNLAFADTNAAIESRSPSIPFPVLAHDPQFEVITRKVIKVDDKELKNIGRFRPDAKSDTKSKELFEAHARDMPKGFMPADGWACPELKIRDGGSINYHHAMLRWLRMTAETNPDLLISHSVKLEASLPPIPEIRSVFGGAERFDMRAWVFDFGTPGNQYVLYVRPDVFDYIVSYRDLRASSFWMYRLARMIWPFQSLYPLPGAKASINDMRDFVLCRALLSYSGKKLVTKCVFTKSVVDAVTKWLQEDSKRIAEFCTALSTPPKPKSLTTPSAAAAAAAAAASAAKAPATPPKPKQPTAPAPAAAAAAAAAAASAKPNGDHKDGKHEPTPKGDDKDSKRAPAPKRKGPIPAEAEDADDWVPAAAAAEAAAVATPSPSRTAKKLKTSDAKVTALDLTAADEEPAAAAPAAAASAAAASTVKPSPQKPAKPSPKKPGKASAAAPVSISVREEAAKSLEFLESRFPGKYKMTERSFLLKGDESYANRGWLTLFELTHLVSDESDESKKSYGEFKAFFREACNLQTREGSNCAFFDETSNADGRMNVCVYQIGKKSSNAAAAGAATYVNDSINGLAIAASERLLDIAPPHSADNFARAVLVGAKSSFEKAAAIQAAAAPAPAAAPAAAAAPAPAPAAAAAAAPAPVALASPLAHAIANGIFGISDDKDAGDVLANLLGEYSFKVAQSAAKHGEEMVAAASAFRESWTAYKARSRPKTAAAAAAAAASSK